MKFVFNRLLAGSLCGLAAVGGATAQDLALSKTEEIVITGTKSARPLNELAGNVAVANSEEIGWVRYEHIADVANRMPGVNIHNNSGQEHLTAIRSPVLTGGAGAGSFLFMEDGIPLRSPGFGNVNALFEAHGEQAARMEVIRGPGSALYGSNAVHGLMNIFSRAPSEVLEANAEIWMGSHEQLVSKLSVSNTFDEHGLRLSATIKHDGGYRDSSGYDQQKFTLRYDRDLGDSQIVANFSGQNLNQDTAGFAQGFKAYKDKSISKANANPEAYRKVGSVRGHVSWTKDYADSALNVTPYFRYTDMEFLMHFLPGQALEKNDHWSLGVQSRWEKNFAQDHSIIVGVDTEYTNGDLSEVQDNPTVFSFVEGVHYDYDVGAFMIAPFVHSEWQLMDKLRLTAGLRLDYTRYNYNNHTASDIVGRFLRVDDRDDSFFSAVPKFGATYQMSEDTSAYASYARGTRAPQTTDLYRLQQFQEAGDIKEEELDSIEAGVRGHFKTLTYDFATFFMKKDNFFFRDSDGINVPNGKTQHYGIEASFAWQMTPAIDLAGSATYARHRYDFDRDVGNASEDISDGDNIDTAPKTLASFRLGWRPLESIRTELEWSHRGEYYLNASNTAKYGGHDVFNLRASYTFNRHIEVFGRVENLGDRSYAERADFAFGNYRYFPGEERSYFAGISLKH